MAGIGVFRAIAGIAALAAAVPLARLSAQTPTAEADCPRITYVFLIGSSIFDAADPNLEGRFGWAYRAANALHVRTREEVIRRELLFGAGDCYDPFLLAESERLLRSYDFLARVDVFGVPQDDGSFHVIVDTRDDWSTQLDVRLRLNGSLNLEGARIRETNALGSGQTVGAFYFERDVTRTYGLSYYTPQLLRTRWDLNAEIGRTRAGAFVRQELAYPFIGEVSHWATRQSYLRDDRYFDYVLDEDAHGAVGRVLVPVREQVFDIALLRRFGTRGTSTTVGAAVSHQELTYPGVVQHAPDGRYETRAPADTATVALVRHQLAPLANVRVFGILGQRSIRWVKRRGFDSLRGQQDVARGAEALLAVGRSVPMLEADNDVQTTLTLYTGMELAGAFIAGRGRFDGRRNLDATALTGWQDVVGDAELLVYLTPHWMTRQTVFLRAAGTGAWNTSTPLQLTLGGERNVRGIAPDRLPGARRVVLSAEHRSDFAWPLPQMFDLGATLFADAGRMWRGDVPFGMDSGWRYSVGAGLRGAFPAGSRTTYRMDLAWPIGAETRLGSARLLLSVGEVLGLGHRHGDAQLLRSRPQGVTGDPVHFR